MVKNISAPQKQLIQEYVKEKNTNGIGSSSFETTVFNNEVPINNKVPMITNDVPSAHEETLMQQVFKAQVEVKTNEHVADNKSSPYIAQIEQSLMANNSFHFSLSNVTNEIVDITTLVGQHNNEQPPFILELIIQQPTAIVDNIVYSKDEYIDGSK